jgi:SAM-dependent methyltransferase
MEFGGARGFILPVMTRVQLIGEFTHQAETFAASTAARSPRTLDELLRLAAPRAGQRWLEVACGPGIISRRLAGEVAAVHGVDVTPAMIDVARREAAAAGIANVTFALGDATELEQSDGAFDGVITRFSLHHIPAPGRVLEEMARVARPGGAIVVADHLADEDADAAAWSQEIERLRDPSHWACLNLGRLRRLGRPAGLTLRDEVQLGLELDFDDWLARGSGGAGARDVIAGLLADPPAGARCFSVQERDGRRMLGLRLWAGRWVRLP